MDISGYLDAIREVHATGVASEHSYRPALRDLFASIDPDLDVVNEPRRVEVGAPDFIFQRDGVARGWAEHKDIDKDVVKPAGYSKEQKERYRQGLPNLIYTNGLDFEFLRDGEPVGFVTIADYGFGLPARTEIFERLETYLREFAAERPIFIRSAGYFAPIYLYPDADAAQADALAPTERTLNLDPKLYAAICEAAGIDPADTAAPDDDFRAPTGDARPSEVKVFDYIYGVLHSPDYRETFAEFLKIDFPRVPYPPSPEVFRHVSEKGEALRRLHLMEPAAIGDTPYPFRGTGDDVVASGYPKFADESGAGKVHINADQYFEGVPQVAWEFHIGGYQPAQKWLKDRKGRALTWDDIGHYQKIVKILLETDRIMREIELPLEQSAG